VHWRVYSTFVAVVRFPDTIFFWKSIQKCPFCNESIYSSFDVKREAARARHIVSSSQSPPEYQRFALISQLSRKLREFCVSRDRLCVCCRCRGRWLVSTWCRWRNTLRSATISSVPASTWTVRERRMIYVWRRSISQSLASFSPPFYSSSQPSPHAVIKR